VIPLQIKMDVERDPIWSESEADKRLFPAELGAVSAIGVLQDGTEEGRPSVTLRIDFADGSFVLGQTTLRLLNMAMTAFRARYGEYLR